MSPRAAVASAMPAPSSAVRRSRAGRAHPAPPDEAPVAANAYIQAFEHLPIGAMICTPDGDRANAELRRIWKASDDERVDRRTIERSIRDTEAPPDGGRVARPGPRPIRDALTGRPTTSLRLFVRRFDDTVGVVRLSAAPLAADDDRRGGHGVGAGGAIVVAIDETTAHAAERLRDAFLGIVGHELRSPISWMVGAAELLGASDLEPDVRAEVLHDLNDEAHRLHRLVEQLLRLADRRGVRAATEPVHLPHLARKVVDRRLQHSARPAIEVRQTRPDIPVVTGEEGFVEQVLDIFLDNAAKYADRSRPIVVSIDADEVEVRLHVLDEGPGIPHGGSDPIFSLFQRQRPDRNARPAEPAGHGIGLFVARSVIEAMNGRIWAANRRGGEGADVGFALPIVRE